MKNSRRLEMITKKHLGSVLNKIDFFKGRIFGRWTKDKEIDDDAQNLTHQEMTLEEEEEENMPTLTTA